MLSQVFHSNFLQISKVPNYSKQSSKIGKYLGVLEWIQDHHTRCITAAMIYTWSKYTPGVELSPPYTDEPPLLQVLLFPASTATLMPGFVYRIISEWPLWTT